APYAFPQLPTPHRSVWGTPTATATTTHLALHISVICPPRTRSVPCVVEVAVPAGSTTCEICQIMAAAINGSAPCQQAGFAAVGDSGLFVTSTNGQVCPGARVSVD